MTTEELRPDEEILETDEFSSSSLAGSLGAIKCEESVDSHKQVTNIVKMMDASPTPKPGFLKR